MKKIGSVIRKLLYRSLSFENYLYVLSKSYFFAFNRGLLKGNKSFEYPYFLKNVIHPGNVIIDIGANLGYLTVVFSKLTGEKGQVHSVEPVKPVLSILKRNTKGLKNVHIYPFALGNENKQIKLGNNTRLKKGYVGSGSHFILDQKSKDEKNADVVFDAEMKKGSELFSQLEQLDFIKCDIEGFETVVLPEIEPLIQKFKPILLVETGGDNRKQMLQFFGERDFQAFILENGSLLPTDETGSRDIFFIPKEKIMDINQYLASASH